MKAAQFNRFGCLVGPRDLMALADPHPGPGRTPDCGARGGRQRERRQEAQRPINRRAPAFLATRAPASTTRSAWVSWAWLSATGCSASPPRQAPRPSWQCCPNWVPMLPSLDFSAAAALPAAVETATRALDQLGVDSGCTLLVPVAIRSVGSAAVQLAAVRGAWGDRHPRAPARSHHYLRSLGVPARRDGYGGVERARAPTPRCWPRARRRRERRPARVPSSSPAARTTSSRSPTS